MSDRTASLRALIQDRKSKDIRRTYTHTFCLQPDLVLEYRVIESDLADLEREREKLAPADDGEKRPTGRMTGDPKLVAVEKSIKAKQAELDAKQVEIEAVAVKIRFKTMRDGRFSEAETDWETRKATTQVKFRETLMECFDRFVDPEGMTKPDFVDLLEVFDEGEYYEAAHAITALMNHVVDVPKFAKPSSGRQK